MTQPENYTSAQASDPHTSGQTLADIAAQRPDLRPAIAANPSTYPALLEWLKGLGDPAVDAALAARAEATQVLPAESAPPAVEQPAAPVEAATQVLPAQETPAAPAAPAAAPYGAPEAAPAPTGVAAKSGGGDWVQPARVVLASGTDYTPAGLGTQVTGLLDRVGVDDAEDARAMPIETSLPAVGASGFTASMTALRECITALTESTQSQALVVDRATYQGSDAGVVVAPTYDDPPSTSPAPTATLTTDMGELDVWVVNPDCSVVDPSVMLHVLHRWAS